MSYRSGFLHLIFHHLLHLLLGQDWSLSPGLIKVPRFRASTFVEGLCSCFCSALHHLIWFIIHSFCNAYHHLNHHLHLHLLGRWAGPLLGWLGLGILDEGSFIWSSRILGLYKGICLLLLLFAFISSSKIQASSRLCSSRAHSVPSTLGPAFLGLEMHSFAGVYYRNPSRVKPSFVTSQACLGRPEVGIPALLQLAG